MNELKAGVYKHYKGDLYLVIGAARHSETGEKLVMHIQLSGRAGAKMWARPFRQFIDEVVVNDVLKPRFVFIGEEVGDVFAKFYDPLSGYKGADRVDS